MDGLTLANGVVVQGTHEAALQELTEVLGKLRGEAGEDVRRNVAATRNLFRESWEKGQSREAMLNLRQYFTEDDGNEI
jgi:thioredoxin-like negative regulator of GroEL